MTNIAMVKPWPIEIDDLPFIKNGWMFHGELLNNKIISMVNVCLSMLDLR